MQPWLSSVGNCQVIESKEEQLFKESRSEKVVHVKMHFGCLSLVSYPFLFVALFLHLCLLHNIETRMFIRFTLKSALLPNKLLLDCPLVLDFFFFFFDKGKTYVGVIWMSQDSVPQPFLFCNILGNNSSSSGNTWNLEMKVTFQKWSVLCSTSIMFLWRLRVCHFDFNKKWKCLLFGYKRYNLASSEVKKTSV